MELFTLAAIIAGIIAAMIGLIIIIKKVSAFYKRRFQFSIWSGVLLIVVALALLLVSTSEGATHQTMYILTAIAAILAILTIYNDIRLAGVAWGSLAVILQIVFSFCLLFLVFFALVGLMLKKLFHMRSALLSSLFGGLGIKSEIILFFHFLHLQGL